MVMNKILALPLFPPELILTVYDSIWKMVKGHRKFETLLEYIGKSRLLLPFDLFQKNMTYCITYLTLDWDFIYVRLL